MMIDTSKFCCQPDEMTGHLISLQKTRELRKYREQLLNLIKEGHGYDVAKLLQQTPILINLKNSEGETPLITV